VEEKNKRENFIKYMANPRAFTLKKWMADILKEDYGKYDGIIERMAMALQTHDDLQDMGSLISQIYDKAYRKAIDDYKEQAEKLGIKVSIGHTKKSLD